MNVCMFCVYSTVFMGTARKTFFMFHIEIFTKVLSYCYQNSHEWRVYHYIKK